MLGCGLAVVGGETTRTVSIHDRADQVKGEEASKRCGQSQLGDMKRAEPVGALKRGWS